MSSGREDGVVAVAFIGGPLPLKGVILHALAVAAGLGVAMWMSRR